MTVDHKAVDDMARLMSILNEKSVGMDETDDMLIETDIPFGDDLDARPVIPPAEPAATGNPDVDAMKAILEKFQAVGGDHLFETEDPDVREALVTEKTPTGARIGSWEIVVTEGDIRQYDVVHTATREPIAKDLYLYEAAYGLVKRLNEGGTINDSRVKDLLRLEEEYAKNRNDAAQYRQRTKTLREKGETVRAAVAEDRYDDASRRAKDAHERILRLAGLR